MLVRSALAIGRRRAVHRPKVVAAPRFLNARVTPPPLPFPYGAATPLRVVQVPQPLGAAELRFFVSPEGWPLAALLVRVPKLRRVGEAWTGGLRSLRAALRNSD